jgi:aspartate ammonia-lyase
MTRSEKDLLGSRTVPATAYWGINTLRAVENFPITGRTIAGIRHFVASLAAVKLAACLANRDLGLLDERRSAAIEQACREVMRGELGGEFVVDVIQGGAGTSTNMNANEVIANRALEVLGKAKGDYAVLHPNDHVNLSQSTNDVYPTAARIALIRQIDTLEGSLKRLVEALHDKSDEFRTVVKMGRTQLQDAVPMTLGREFAAFATTLGEDVARLRESSALLHEVNLGATAIGTGLAAPAGFAAGARKHLCTITGLDLVGAPDLVEATSDVGAYVHLSSALKRLAIKVSKTSSDLRLLSSGPRGGMAEIGLPPVQSGSSIMPGKVNPVIPEVVNQVAYQVIGNDLTVTMAADGGQLQLNAFQPIIVHTLHESLVHLTHALDVLADRCVVGITADAERLRATLTDSIGLATALAPQIGYAAATAVAEAARTSGRTVPEVVAGLGLLAHDVAADLLDPLRLADGHHPPFTIARTSDATRATVATTTPSEQESA